MIVNGRVVRRKMIAGLKALLEPRGFELGAKIELAKRREELPGFVVVWIELSPKWAYTGVCRSFFVSVGLGTGPRRDDVSPVAVLEFERILGDGPLVREKCEIHNEVVRSFRGVSDVPPGAPDGDRVAMLLDWTVRDDWRNAPEVFWFSKAEHIDRWVEFLSRALPPAISRVERSHIDFTQKPVRFELADP